MGASWRCPQCGRRFVNTRQSHSCGNPALTDVLDRASPAAVAVYDRIEAALVESGSFRVHPQHTRIAFISEMTFASVRLARRWVDLSFIVEEVVDDHRVRALDVYGPTSFDHRIRLPSPAAVDDDVGGWLDRARRRGDRATLDPRAQVEPLTGRPLELARVPLRSTVVRRGDALGLTTPRYAAELFAAHPAVIAQIGGDRHRAVLRSDGERSVLVLEAPLGALGLGEGDPVDVYLSAEL